MIRKLNAITLLVMAAFFLVGTASAERIIDGNRNQAAVADMDTHKYDNSSPCIAVSSDNLSFHTPYRGVDPCDKTLFISNSGGQTLYWSITGDASWLNVSPRTGSATSYDDQIGLSVDVRGMANGTYQVPLKITGIGATNSPRTVIVTLKIGEREPDDGTTFDIMFVWPTNDSTVSEETLAQIEKTANYLVGYGNGIFENSQIVPRLNLVYSGPAFGYGRYPPTRRDQAEDPDDGYMDEVHILREIYGGDLVCVLSGEGVGGIFHSGARLGRDHGDQMVWVHEMGHGLTLTHSTPHVFICEDYGHKHYTVMKQPGGGAIPHFSNPSVYYHGTATGTDEHNSAGIVNLRANEIANRTVTPPKRVIYVKQDATGYNDGSSWEDAFYDLKLAFEEYNDAKAGHLDEIWVAEGTYTPGSSEQSTFRLIQAVSVYGGFAGTESFFEQRDPATHKTILSGDDVCYHVVTAPDDGFRVLRGLAILDGFTIKGGCGDRGAGIYVHSASPIIRNCVIEGNSTALYGGGIYAEDSDIEIASCIFRGNYAASRGGGMYIRNSSPTLANCTFVENSAQNGNALACNSQGSPSNVGLINCILWDGGNEIWNNDGSTIDITYSNVQYGQAGVYDPCEAIVWGEANIDADPLFANPDANDFHLNSQVGRWDPNPPAVDWIQDDFTSPCIDAGDPDSPIGHEPFPNGGVVNMGAYGGTAHASKSYFGRTVCRTIIAGDINGDCRVDFSDLVIMAAHWLKGD